MKLSPEAQTAAVQASERELRHLNEELHSTLCQSLGGLTFLVQVLIRRAQAGKPVDLAQLEKLGDTMRYATEETHGLRRKLQPMQSNEGGLAAALEDLAKEAARHLPCAFHPGESLPATDAATALALFRIAEEAVVNAVAHAHATSLTISLTHRDGRLALSVSDDGSGFVHTPNESIRGIDLMRARADAIGAELTIQSNAGTGVAVRCELGKAKRKA